MTLAAHPKWNTRSWQGHEHGAQGREPQPHGAGRYSSTDPSGSRQGSVFSLPHSLSFSQFENLLLGLEVMQPGPYQVFFLS